MNTNLGYYRLIVASGAQARALVDLIYFVTESKAERKLRYGSKKENYELLEIRVWLHKYELEAVELAAESTGIHVKIDRIFFNDKSEVSWLSR